MSSEVSVEKFKEAVKNCDDSDKSISRLCVLLSNLSYFPHKEASEFLSAIDNIESYEVTLLKRTQVITIIFKDKVLTAFQGSNSLRHWVSNLDLRGVKTEAGIFPYGFYRAASEFLDHRIMLTIFSHSEDHQIIWCGHSRGGAIAGISAALMNTWNIKSSHVITFGAPKFADESHIDWVKTEMKETKHIQYVHAGDPVSTLPPSSVDDFLGILASVLWLPFSRMAKFIGIGKNREL